LAKSLLFEKIVSNYYKIFQYKRVAEFFSNYEVTDAEKNIFDDLLFRLEEKNNSQTFTFAY